jgi:hypothetical protein
VAQALTPPAVPELVWQPKAPQDVPVTEPATLIPVAPSAATLKIARGGITAVSAFTAGITKNIPMKAPNKRASKS